MNTTPPTSNGVVQRSMSRLGDDGAYQAWTEWLEFPDSGAGVAGDPMTWTQDSARAFLFLGDAKHTGYERAQAFADVLNKATHSTAHHGCTRSQVRPPKEPPMPARVLDRRLKASRTEEDWHAKAPNCGVI